MSSNVHVERFIRAARLARCPEDQLLNLLSMGIVLSPRQLEASATARLCDLDGGPTELGYGGARGGGKSHWLLAQLAEDCRRCPGLKCLLLRKVGKALKESFEDLLRKVLVGVHYTYVPSAKTLYIHNKDAEDSIIILGHFKDEREIDAYLGLEYDVIGVEEATTLTSSKYKGIQSCNRTSKLNWRPRMYSTTNPGNLGHAWYKARFVEPYRRRQETSTRFIPATVDDNPAVNKEYRAILDSFTGWQYKAWRLGDWDIAAGQYFVTFRRDVHMRDLKRRPASWPVWGSLDHGYHHYTTFYLLTQADDGDIYILDEVAARLTPLQVVADEIKGMLGRHGLTPTKLRTIVAGADVFAERDEGPTTAANYKKHGIRLKPANQDRKNGASEILVRLGDVDRNIQPLLWISSRCRGLLETLPALEHDPNRAEDVLKWDTDEDGIGGDDYYDGARYGVMAGRRAKRQTGKVDWHGKASRQVEAAPLPLRSDDEIERMLEEASE